MQIKDLTPDFSVAGQILPSDIAAIAARGVKLIVSNRPDFEESGQPTYAEVEAAARSHGIDTVFIPIRPGQQTPTDVTRMDAALRAAKGPVLAYCRSGGRAESLWRATGRG